VRVVRLAVASDQPVGAAACTAELGVGVGIGVGQQGPGCSDVRLVLAAHGVARPLLACTRGGLRAAGRLTPGTVMAGLLVETTVDLSFDWLALRRGQLSAAEFQRRVAASALGAATCAVLTVAVACLVAGGSPAVSLLVLVVVPLVAAPVSRRLVAVMTA
jgi:hypothetical protein